ncbi:hypothetical protein [Streptomyces sp. NPDC006552]
MSLFYLALAIVVVWILRTRTARRLEELAAQRGRESRCCHHHTCTCR